MKKLYSCKECGTPLDGRNRKAYCAACRPRKPQRAQIDWDMILKPDGVAVAYVEATTDQQDGIAPSSRDLLYFLVEEAKHGDFWFPNDRSAYTVLNRKTAELRDELRFPPLSDATRTISTRFRAETPEEILTLLEELVGLSDLTEGQTAQVWIAVEKRGLIPRMERAFTDPYGIPVIPLGGFASQPLRADVRRWIEADGRPAHLFYAADFDPSGWFLGRDFATKSRINWASVTRVALTMAQVEQYDIPPNPAPTRDPRLERFIAETGTDIQVEVNALEVVKPGLLAELFLDAIQPHIDNTVHRRNLTRERAWRDTIVTAIQQALAQLPGS